MIRERNLAIFRGMRDMLWFIHFYVWAHKSKTYLALI